jgi:glycosyltransferase involved in cell wall biosynthesis
MSTGVAGDASAVIVHSRVVRGALLRERPGVPAFEIPLAVAPAPDYVRDDARLALGLPLDRVVAATLGVVTPAKRIGKLLEGLALLPPRARPLLVVGGAVGAGDPLLESVRVLGLAQDVRFTGYLSDDDFWRLARAADVAVNLRFPTVGETSGAVCRLAGSGLPVVVSDVGWFRELPDAFASKIPVGEGETDAIAAALGTLAADEELRGAQAAAARAWGEKRSPAHIASAHAYLLRAVAEGRTAPLSLLGRVASAAAAVGVGRNGSLDSRERQPDGLVLEALGERGVGILPPPLTPDFGIPQR